jgi:hypothetical protein
MFVPKRLIELSDFFVFFTKYNFEYTRWFKYDRDKLWLVYTQIVPVIFEPPCNWNGEVRIRACDVPHISLIALRINLWGFLLFLSLFTALRTFPQTLLQSAINELDSCCLSAGRRVEYIAQISASIGFLSCVKSFWRSRYVVCSSLEREERNWKEFVSHWTSK